jgi:hypothetical protein
MGVVSLQEEDEYAWLSLTYRTLGVTHLKVSPSKDDLIRLTRFGWNVSREPTRRQARYITRGTQMGDVLYNPPRWLLTDALRKLFLYEARNARLIYNGFGEEFESVEQAFTARVRGRFHGINHLRFSLRKGTKTDFSLSHGMVLERGKPPEEAVIETIYAILFGFGFTVIGDVPELNDYARWYKNVAGRGYFPARGWGLYPVDGSALLWSNGHFSIFGPANWIDDRDVYGQVKLQTMELGLLSLSDDIFYVGGSPGHHLVPWAEMGKKITIVDPRPISPRLKKCKNVVHSQRLFGGEFQNMTGKVFISDIRPDRGDMSDEEWSQLKREQTELQIEWAKIAREAGALATSVKFWYDAEMLLPYGDLFPQPFLRPGSIEYRWIWRKGEIQNPLYYEGMLDVSEGWAANRAIYQSSLALGVMEGVYQPKEGMLNVAMYSISNCENAIDTSRIKQIVLTGGYVVVPMIGAFDKLRQWSWCDSVYNVDMLLDESLSAFTALDFINKSGKASVVELSNTNNLAWAVLTRRKKETFQTVFNSQTHYVKTVTTLLRRTGGHTSETLHAIRREVGSQYGLKPVDDLRVSGYLESKGRRYYVAIAGHMINMLVAASYFIIDIPRYIDTLEFNARHPKRRRRDMEELSGAGKLWHSQLDYWLALEVYRQFTNRLKLPFSQDRYEYVKRRLLRWPETGKRMGFQSQQMDPGTSAVFDVESFSLGGTVIGC